jgi:subtilisin family serine protease
LKSHGKAPDVRDHGLFVAGLVHVVAPESEIHLFRVLNHKNQGDLATLISALKLFTNRRMGTRGTLSNTVINLSLGVHPPPNLRTAGLEGLEDWVSRVCERNMGRYEPLTEHWATIPSLQTVLQAAYRQGAVIVAAAGNDSRDPPEVKPAQIPAAYPFVIGVAGSNFCGDRACFSNAGDVAAPSGDVGRAGRETVINCNRWPGFCITSLAIHTGRRRAKHTGFAHWMGTSFATPLVSGQAALLLKNMSPDDVRRAIEKTAVEPSPPDPNLGAGVIDLPPSLLFQP